MTVSHIPWEQEAAHLFLFFFVSARASVADETGATPRSEVNY